MDLVYTGAGLAGAVFLHQAGGSLVSDSRGQIIGLSLIAQGFATGEDLRPRPSAAGAGYDPLNSGGNNLGLLDQKLIDRMKGDAVTIAREYGPLPIPADALTTSARGLDPDVTPQNARLHLARIAARQGVFALAIQALIDTPTVQPVLGFIGQPTVNVLAVSRALDARYPMVHPRTP